MPGVPKTYAELIAAIAGYINKRNLDAEIAGFIRAAEDEINTRLRDRRMIVTREAEADCGSIALPPGWLEAKRVMLRGATRPLSFVPLSEAPGASGGRYTIRGTTLDLLPPPPSDAVVELVYFEAVPYLTDDARTNWLLDQEPMLYVYGGCLHAMPYLVDDERVPAWRTYFDNRIETLNAASDRAQHSGGPLVRRRGGFP